MFPTQRMLERGLIQFEPFSATAMAIYAAASAVSAGIGAISSIQSGRRASNIEKQNAVIAGQRASAEAKKHREDTIRRLGTTRAAFGASGVDMLGTPDDVMRDNELTAGRENALILWGGLGQSTDHLNRAKSARAQGISGGIAGFGQMAGSLLTAGYSYNQMTNPPRVDLGGGGFNGQFYPGERP